MYEYPYWLDINIAFTVFGMRIHKCLEQYSRSVSKYECFLLSPVT